MLDAVSFYGCVRHLLADYAEACAACNKSCMNGLNNYTTARCGWLGFCVTMLSSDLTMNCS